MKYNCQNKTLRNVETTAMNLHCSRRQLQRILKKLLDEQKINKKRNISTFMIFYKTNIIAIE